MFLATAAATGVFHATAAAGLSLAAVVAARLRGGGEAAAAAAGSGDISCCHGRGGRRSGNDKVDDGADEARGGDEWILVQHRG